MLSIVCFVCYYLNVQHTVGSTSIFVDRSVDANETCEKNGSLILVVLGSYCVFRVGVQLLEDRSCAPYQLATGTNEPMMG